MTLPALRLQPPRPGWGVRTPVRKSLATSGPILVLPPPPEVTLALAAGALAAATPCVAVGAPVRLGEPVARAAGPGGAPIHASIAGTVTAIDWRTVAGVATPVPTLTINGDGSDARWDGYAPLADPEREPPEQLLARLAAAGILGLGGALFPAARKLDDCAGVHTLLINGAECEPYISCDDMLLRERADRVVDGTRLLLAATGIPRAVFAVKNDMPAARSALYDALEAAADARLSLAVVTARYPAGGERQLIELVMDCEVPAGGLPRDAGVICQNVATVAAVADFLRRGQPLVSRIVTVTGGGVVAPRNVEARLGTPVATLIAAAGGYCNEPQRLVMGGPMMGVALPDDALPITAATNCLLAATVTELPDLAGQPELACIRCGACSDACPARLLPQTLLTACRTGDVAALATLGVGECIECGACDYVCPSHIALTTRFVAGKAQLAARERADASAAEAAARFAAHAARLARDADERARELAAMLPPDPRA